MEAHPRFTLSKTFLYFYLLFKRHCQTNGRAIVPFRSIQLRMVPGHSGKPICASLCLRTICTVTCCLNDTARPRQLDLVPFQSVCDGPCAFRKAHLRFTLSQNYVCRYLMFTPTTMPNPKRSSSISLLFSSRRSMHTQETTR